MKYNTCYFIGHRELKETDNLKEQISVLVEKIIVEYGVGTFLVGSKSRFNELCYAVVTGLKQKYPHIKRVFVRAEYPLIDDDYRAYLLKIYEDTYFPQNILKSGKAVYVERNNEMIEKSDICVFYYKDENKSDGRKSGTATALKNAKKKRKVIILID